MQEYHTLSSLVHPTEQQEHLKCFLFLPCPYSVDIGPQVSLEMRHHPQSPVKNCITNRTVVYGMQRACKGQVHLARYKLNLVGVTGG